MLRANHHGRRSVLRQSLVLLFCLGLTSYFAYHIVYGRHGLLARQSLVERASLLEFEMKSLEAVRARLRRDVTLLAPELPDPDIVEETAREMLGFVHAEDKVITLRN